MLHAHEARQVLAYYSFYHGLTSEEIETAMIKSVGCTALKICVKLS